MRRTPTDTILEVRRDLFFGRVSPDMALRRLEMLSAGMRVADYLQRLTDPMIALLSVISQESNRRLTVLEAAVATVGAGDRPLAESERVILVTALQSSAPHPALPRLIERFEASMKQLEQQGMTIANQGGSPVEVAQAVGVFAPMIMEEQRKAARIDECTAILHRRVQAWPAT